MSNIELLHGDCLDVLPTLPDNSVDLILTDPPYFKVKKEKWDRQWSDPQAFLSWLDKVAAQWQRVLKPNGSLYCFASPKMAARVEVMLGERFNVINRIRWLKSAGWHNKNRPEDLRGFLSPWEEIIFCEHYGADNIAKGEAGYGAKCDELRGFVFEPLRAYLDGERQRAGVKKEALNLALGFRECGGMASRKYLSQSQFQIPTLEHYTKLQTAFPGYFTRPYEDLCQEYERLRQEYEHLRQEYEHLRQEYEHLRRPFNVSADVPYTDVWTFATVKPYPGKHPCEKPQDLLQHAITASSREGAVVLDSFMGTGSTGLACLATGREFIGIEQNAEYLDIARARIAHAVESAKPDEPETAPLFMTAHLEAS